jgi:CHAT domain-containing protein
MGPLLARLRELELGAVALLPSGLLALLPLHAAWEARQDGARRYALDIVELTYAPSARALAHARRLADSAAADRLLAIDNPGSIGTAQSLNLSATEVHAVSSYFPVVGVLRGADATHQAVLQQLARADVVHLSCHGRALLRDPLESGVLLTDDRMLTVADLLGLRLPGARLATLSACETAMVGLQLPDELVSLPAGFLQAGFAGVVATLWAVDEVSTAMLMERFYRLWRVEGLAPAAALREAQRWLRDTTNAEKAAYFGRDLPALSGAKLPDDAAELYARAMLKNPKARSFEHPVSWAAFALTGC